MNRRGFLGVLLAGAVLSDPERALWIPGKKLISIPAPRVRTCCVTIFDRYTHRVIERWWKDWGGVYRQVRNEPLELTPFTEVPFVQLTPLPTLLTWGRDAVPRDSREEQQAAQAIQVYLPQTNVARTRRTCLPDQRTRSR